MTPITQFTPDTQAYWENESLTNKDLWLSYNWRYIGENGEIEEYLESVRLYSDIDFSQSDEDARAEFEHEQKCENAWLTKAEYDPEAQDEMNRF